MYNIKTEVMGQQFMSVEYKDINGKLQTAWGKANVKKHLSNSRVKPEPGCIFVWDFYTKSYVNVPKDSILSVNGRGITFEDRSKVSSVEHRRETTMSRMFKRSYKIAVERR